MSSTIDAIYDKARDALFADYVHDNGHHYRGSWERFEDDFDDSTPVADIIARAREDGLLDGVSQDALSEWFEGQVSEVPLIVDWDAMETGPEFRADSAPKPAPLLQAWRCSVHHTDLKPGLAEKGWDAFIAETANTVPVGREHQRLVDLARSLADGWGRRRERGRELPRRDGERSALTR